MENNQYVTVFGATGKIGSALLNFLSAEGIPAIAVTRDKSKAVALPFVEWVVADMFDKDSLYKTMDHSNAVFLSSAMGNHFVTEQQQVIQVAVETGVAHIVKLSSAAVGSSIGSSAIAASHGAVEDYLKAAGILWTILRPTGFMQNWLGEFSQRVKSQRTIEEATGDGKRAYIDLRDIAEVAGTILKAPADHAGNTYMLTGGEAINYAQLATMLSAVAAGPVTYIPLTLEEGRQRLEQKGLPPWGVQTFMAYAEVQRNGDAALVSSAVSDILQKPARTAEAFVQDYAAWFK
ncbi:MAG: NmrA family NAD(P)-binding protein [Chitinophaga sp.]|uniref:NmrA family NAD(P)-binding protein n=1 Tax=Chitinophaga sp. TaxID=1869181 RepID=UPI001AFF0118|nr:NmrA family NAD(P)-binding protein [Chitinophaga sp.]MBO9732798.1 NmrA family NAD(P)-binding protein [Chitinophaga sp.]